MIECNIYTGRKGLINYEFTDEYNSLLEAEIHAQELAECDAAEFGYPLEECDWMAVEAATDNVPYDERVGLRYMQ